MNATCPRCAHSFHFTAPVPPSKGRVLPLTFKQSEIYRYLAGSVLEHGYAPSFEEIADVFSYASLATVHEHLSNLERKGWIRRAYNEARAITCAVPVDKIESAALTGCVP